MLKKQLQQIIKNKFELLKKISNIKKKQIFIDWTVISISTLHITKKVLKITIVN